MRLRIVTSGELVLPVVKNAAGSAQVHPGKVNPGTVLEITDRSYRGANLKGYINQTRYVHDEYVCYVTLDQDDRSPETMLAKLALGKSR